MSILEQAEKTFREKAIKAKSWEEFWADVMNYSSGNVKSIIWLFNEIGLDTNDIEHAWKQLTGERH